MAIEYDVANRPYLRIGEQGRLFFSQIPLTVFSRFCSVRYYSDIRQNKEILMK